MNNNSLFFPFMENAGQQNDQVAFYTRIFGGMFYITRSGELVYCLGQAEEATKGVALQEEMVGGCIRSIDGEEREETRVSYFMGSDPEKWRSGIPTFNVVSMREVYEGIDVKLRACGNNVEKLFFVKPGACPDEIRIKVSGAQTMSTDGSGALRIETALGTVMFTRPVAFQYLRDPSVEGAFIKKTVAVAYEVSGNEYGFKTGDYNEASMLIIDPLLASTFLGGSTKDGTWRGVRMVLAADGGSYVTGQTSSANFPTTLGAYDHLYNGGITDLFVAKLSKDLKTLTSATFIGGSGREEFPALALDSNGDLFVMAQTTSTNFPVTAGAYDVSYNGGDFDSVIFKLNSRLTTLLASTYLGGSQTDASSSNDIAVDRHDNPYVLSRTESTDFPTTPGAFDDSYNGQGDLFLSRFDNSLSLLTASTFLGGGLEDDYAAVKITGNGEVVASGSTSSADFPVTPGAYDTHFSGAYYDIFISRFDADLTTLLASTYLGGDPDGGTGKCLVLDANDNIYVSGHVSEGFPTTPGAYDEIHNGFQEGFIAKMDIGLTTLLASTFLSGPTSSFGHGSTLICDRNGSIYISGYTPSLDFPVTASAYDTTYNGGDDDAYIAKFDLDLTTLRAATYLGGAGMDGGESLAIDRDGNVRLAGITKSTDFPITPGAHDASFNGGAFDIFVVSLDSDLSADPPLKADSQEISARMGGEVHFTLTAGEVNGGRVYVILGSTSGTDPGFPLPGGMATLPLNRDPFTDKVIALLNTPLFSDFLGTLDSAGIGTAGINATPLAKAHVGLLMHFAYCLADPFDFASNPVEVRVVP